MSRVEQAAATAFFIQALAKTVERLLNPEISAEWMETDLNSLKTVVRSYLEFLEEKQEAP